MTATHSYLTTVPLLLLCVGCSSVTIRVQAKPDYDFTQVKTYDWVERPEDKNPAEDLAPGFRARLRASIEVALADRGWTRSTDAPDVRVVFYGHMKTRQKWVSTYGYSYVPWQVDPWGYTYGTWVRVRRLHPELYEVGTVVVDVIDTKSNELAWRGWAQRAADRELKERDLVKIMRRLVRELP